MIFQDEKTPFQAIKSRSSKSRKIDIFPKGFMAIFQLFFFWAIYGRKMSFMIFENEKTPFQAITRSSKSRKNEIFPKGFKPRFWAKTGQFSNYFFQAIYAKNILLCYSRTKKLGYKNKKFQKTKNCHFSKGVNPWFWFKNSHFPNFFLGNICQENVFYDILEGENVFRGQKNKKQEKSEEWTFFQRG